MKLEEEIKQDRFENEHHKALLNIIVSSNWINGLTTTVLRPFNISPQQFNVLRILRGQYPTPVTLGLIQERMLDKMSDTSRIVDRLVVKELVKKETCPKDRRLVDVTITERGQQLLKSLDAEANHMEEIMSNLSEKEAAQLSSLLDKLRGGE